MSSYGDIAVSAVEILSTTPSLTPLDAWKQAVRNRYPGNPRIYNRTRGYPRSTFLGLCEAGLVQGVPKGLYVRRTRTDKQYAIAAVKQIEQKQLTCETCPNDLWKLVEPNKEHNQQMEVVLGLHRKHLLNMLKQR